MFDPLNLDDLVELLGRRRLGPRVDADETLDTTRALENVVLAQGCSSGGMW